MKMVIFATIVALALGVSSLAFADTAADGGTLKTQAFSHSQGSAMSAAQIAGTGFSAQTAWGATGGTAFGSTSLVAGPTGAVTETASGTVQFSHAGSAGVLIGGQAFDANGLIMNGSQGFASTEVEAKGFSKFHGFKDF